jgi:hypothetical protein
MMIFLHLQDSFIYGIVFICDGLIFSGVCAEPLLLSLENLSITLLLNTTSSIVREVRFLNGYVFYKGSSIDSVSNVMVKKVKL